MIKDWVKCRFEDLLDYEQPTNYIVNSTEYDDSYETPVLTAGKSFIKGYTNEKDGVFDNLPTIIFDDFTTASQFVNFKFKVKSSAMKILVPTSDLINMKFVYCAMQVNKVRSDTHKRYWISIYSKKEIFIPSVNEQRAIVAKIEELFSELDKGEEDLKKAQEQLMIYRQAVLKKAFEGDWDKVELGSVCDKVLKVKRKEMPLDTQLLYLDIGGIDNVKNKIVDHKEFNWENAPSRAQQIVKVGDILFSTVRTYLKNIARVEKPIYENEIASSGFTVIRGKTGVLNSKYIFYLTTSQFFLEPLNELQRGTSYPAVRDKDVFSQLIPLPNIPDQENIVQEIESRLSVCDSIEDSIHESLNKSKALRQSILKKAFEGTLLSEEEIAACKAAPDYEPASVLLERIKAEKKKN